MNREVKLHRIYRHFKGGGVPPQPARDWVDFSIIALPRVCWVCAHT